MSSSAQAELEQQVLERIEHSPTGAVPHTPLYQTALGHLRAAFQVYPSAEYKDGWVTARSLAAKPVFHAANLEAVLAGREPSESLEPDADVFARYVASLPPALQPRADAARNQLVARKLHHRAKHKAEVQHEPVHALFLLPGGGNHAGLPGSYLHGAVIEHPATASTPAFWSVDLHDSEDGAMIIEVPAAAAALEKVQELLASAPFHLAEIEPYGFHHRH